MKTHHHLFLLMGQSNMAGRGEIGPEDTTPHPRVWMFTHEETWAPAVEPVTRDRDHDLGTGPALTFGKVLAEAWPGATIGLVPCAVGGTPLARWQKGADLYARAVARARLAQQHGTLEGVLWHQGESDTNRDEDARSYGARLAGMIHDLRADLGRPGLPFVAGQLGEFLLTRVQKPPELRAIPVNEALAALPERVPGTACVASAGLAHSGDELHFSGAAQHELGRRYAAALLRLMPQRTTINPISGNSPQRYRGTEV